MKMNTEIRTLLIEAARNNRPVYYGEIMSKLGLVRGLSEDHAELSEVLENISVYENEHGRPLLSSIARYSPESSRTYNGETHGNGFYEFAERLTGKRKAQLKQELFAITEMTKSIDYWQNDEKYNEFANLMPVTKHKMEFFKPEEIEFLTQWASKVYEKNNPEHVAAKNFIMNSLGSKTVYWSKELKKNLPEYDIFNWRMWSQPGWDQGVQVSRFKPYTWARIFKIGDMSKDIFFTVGVDSGKKELVYKLDYYFENGSNLNPQQKKIVDDNIPNELAWKGIPMKELAHYDWDRLIKESTSFIAENSHVYDKLIRLSWGGEDAATVFTNNLIKRNPPIRGYSELPPMNPTFNGVETDPIETAIENKELGDAGEELVVSYERKKLRELGKHSLADEVEKVENGNGYDVISFDEDGNKIYIEVKTTRGDHNTPFFYTINEYLFAERNPNNYLIYRLYNFNDDTNNADFYVINRPLESLLFQPTNFKVYHKNEQQ